jgi:transporter family protein
MNWLFWASLSAVFAAVTAILAKFGVEGVDPNLATAIRTSFVVAFTWLVYVFLSPAGAGRGLTRHSWIFLFASGIATALSWLCYFRALQLGPVSRVAPIDKLSVALVMLIGVLLLRERLTWGQAIGGCLIVCGAILTAIK